MGQASSFYVTIFLNEEEIAMTHALRFLFAAVPLVFALTVPEPTTAVPTCNCDTTAMCRDMHGGNKSWYCAKTVPRSALCAVNGSLDGLCKQATACEICDADADCYSCCVCSGESSSTCLLMCN